MADEAVTASRETVAVASSGDAADDPAIWVDANDPFASRLIGTDKKAGLYVYDLNGTVVQFVPDGLPNNVDLRDGFPFAGGAAPIVAASDRRAQTIDIFRFDPLRRTLDPVRLAAIPSGFAEVYGFCLAKDADGVFYAIATSKQGGLRQWRLTPAADGAVTAQEVRHIELGSIAEGLVADDALSRLYVAEENAAIWRLELDPAKGDGRAAVAKVDGADFVADIEGLTLYAAKDGAGYLIASIQGRSAYAVFERGGDNAYLGSFVIAAGEGIDGTSDTDGIDVTSADLGPQWPGGMFVAQDGTNPGAAQNFKLVPFARIEAAIAAMRKK